MQDGFLPARAWDGRMFDSELRLATAGAELLYTACLCVVKGDWAEFCSTFGFANWQTKAAPCYCCWATVDNYLLDQDFRVGHTIWPDFTMQDYLDACFQSEVEVVVRTLPLLNEIRGSLFF